MNPKQIATFFPFHDRVTPCSPSLPTPEVPMTPAHFTADKNSPSTGGANKYLFSFSPQLRPKPHPVPSNAPNRSSEKLVNIFGGKCQHHDVIRDLRFLSPGLRCSAALTSAQSAGLPPANPPWLRRQGCQNESAGEQRCEQKGHLSRDS